MSGVAWVVGGIIAWAILCFLAWILAEAMKELSQAEETDDEIARRMAMYKENQWP